MGRRKLYFTPEQAKEAKRRRERIWRARNREQINARNRELRAGKGVERPGYIRELPVRPSPLALQRRHVESLLWANCEITPNMVVLGDPPPWRSALHRMR